MLTSYRLLPLNFQISFVAAEKVWAQGFAQWSHIPKRAARQGTLPSQPNKICHAGISLDVIEGSNED